MTQEELYRDFYPYAAAVLRRVLGELDSNLISGLSHYEACIALSDYMRMLLGMQWGMEQRLAALSSSVQDQGALNDLLAFQAHLRTFEK